MCLRLPPKSRAKKDPALHKQCKVDKKIPLGLGKSLFGVDLSSDFGSVGFSLDGTSSTVTTSSVVFRKTEAPAARNPLEAKANRKLLCAILQLSENVVKKSITSNYSAGPLLSTIFCHTVLFNRSVVNMHACKYLIWSHYHLGLV